MILTKEELENLKFGKDKNLEFNKQELKKTKNLQFTHNVNDLKLVNCFIITVPTPIDKNKKPDLKPLMKQVKLLD